MPRRLAPLAAHRLTALSSEKSATSAVWQPSMLNRLILVCIHFRNMLLVVTENIHRHDVHWYHLISHACTSSVFGIAPELQHRPSPDLLWPLSGHGEALHGPVQRSTGHLKENCHSTNWKRNEKGWFAPLKGWDWHVRSHLEGFWFHALDLIKAEKRRRRPPWIFSPRAIFGHVPDLLS